MKSQDTEMEQDPFLCKCGPCKKFWQDSFHGVSSSLTFAPQCRVAGSSFACHGLLRYGDRVIVKGKHTGAVRYVGYVDDRLIAPRLYVGVKLDDNVNSIHNGMYKGKRYFTCPLGHGAMVKLSDIRPLPLASPRPLVKGNTMFPSFKEVCQRRKEREERLANLYSEAQPSKSYSGRAAPKPPSITPRLTKTSNLRMSSAPPIFSTGDPHDVALKDEKRKLERQQLNLLEATLVSPEEQQMRRWQQLFGGKKDGHKMASTLQKLHQAYEKGLHISRRKSSTTSSDS
ncbi:dynactin subunit 1-like [Haliotis cracherodii]|uniref:dynactin subunit 1-like n=1 Tax=Haliotis cracherodii TaxID=6455 RepID=UPI0039ED7508